MPTPATAAAAAISPSLFLQSLPSAAPIAPLSRPSLFRPCPTAIILPFRARHRVTCQAVISADVSSSAEIEEEEQLAAAKIGKRVRVIVPLKVYHVQKAPDLDLNGLEGVIKQYVGVWKGKRISANLPFKVEFQIEVEGQPRPVKFISHLKEDEFEYVD
ncbi:ferredoxin-thioredoxin reductase, variable chain-like [Curcuma longa]|uniref:ferredoxin-thioredoxin reductase, variable chain-like n=1 Tax=Curcuma longa TaxID=136217 RepID=UPI003D9F41B2